MSQSGKKNLLLLLVLTSVALSMRAAMSCVGPLTGAIRESLGLSSAVAGFLTTIPLIVFSLTAPFAGQVAAAVDTRGLMLGCLAVNAVGILVRSYAGLTGLFVGTALLGLATGTLNVMMPAWIRHQFKGRVGLMMGVYSTVMTASSALSAGLCQPLMELLSGWRGSLAASALLCVIAAVICVAARRAIAPRLPAPAGDSHHLRYTKKHLCIAGFMGLQSFLFFAMLAWYPSMVSALCPGFTMPGILVTLMQLASLIPAFVVPILSSRMRNKGLLACGMTLLFTLGFGLVLAAGASRALVLTGTVFIGLGSGATMSLALTIVAMQGSSASETAKISGFCQCIGYLIAACGPTGFGRLYDALGSWTPILAVMIVLSVVMALLGLAAGAPSRRSPEQRR